MFQDHFIEIEDSKKNTFHVIDTLGGSFSEFENYFDINKIYGTKEYREIISYLAKFNLWGEWLTDTQRRPDFQNIPENILLDSYYYSRKAKSNEIASEILENDFIFLYKDEYLRPLYLNQHFRKYFGDYSVHDGNNLRKVFLTIDDALELIAIVHNGKISSIVCNPIQIFKYNKPKEYNYERNKIENAGDYIFFECLKNFPIKIIAKYFPTINYFLALANLKQSFFNEGHSRGTTLKPNFPTAPSGNLICLYSGQPLKEFGFFAKSLKDNQQPDHNFKSFKNKNSQNALLKSSLGLRSRQSEHNIDNFLTNLTKFINTSSKIEYKEEVYSYSLDKKLREFLFSQEDLTESIENIIYSDHATIAPFPVPNDFRSQIDSITQLLKQSGYDNLKPETCLIQLPNIRNYWRES